MSALVFCALLLPFQMAFAQTEIDVGPAIIERSDSVSVIDAKQIEKSYAQSSDDVLRAIPGLAVARSGGPGQPSFIYIRGADSEGTLVLLDGLPLNDPSLSNKAFDFSLLALDAIERVEVWKGPQSVLFGSGATGGVINIISKKGRGPRHSKIGIEAGSFKTFKANASSLGASGPYTYSIAANRVQSSGISAANENLGNTERDGTWINTLSTKLGWSPNSENEIEVTGRWSNKYAALDYAPSDSPPFIFADAGNYHMNGDSLALGLVARHQWQLGFDSSLNVMRYTQARTYVNDPEPANPAWLKSHYTGEFYRIENINLWRPLAGTEISFGPSADFENASSYYHSSSFNAESPREDSSMIGAMTRLQYDQRYVFLTAGARYDRHNRYGEQTAFETGPGVHLTPSLDLMGRFATAYKAPTLFELYDPKTGNDQLQPEHVQGYELALTQFFDAHKSRLQLSLFKNEFRNLVQFAANKFSNVGSAVASGVELEGRKDFGWIDFQFGYTYLETRDDRTGLSLQRRPRNSLTAKVEVRPTETTSASLDFVSVDHRDDLSPITSQPTIVASYQVLNSTAEWQALPALKLYARGLNLMDLKYEEVSGYGTYRRSVFVGIIYGL